MTLEELLKKQGLSDEQIKTIQTEMKQNKIFTSSEENIDIRYGKLKTDFDNLTTQHGESTKLIEQLKAGTKGNEELQKKVTTYETQVAELQKKLDSEKLDNAINLALRDSKALDAEYLAFKLHEKYKDELALDESGKIRGIEDKIAGLKTQFPKQFETEQQQRQIDPQPLPGGEARKTEPMTLEEAVKEKYEDKK